MEVKKKKQKTGVLIVLSEKIDFKTKTVIKTKKSMIKESVQQKI